MKKLALILAIGGLSLTACTSIDSLPTNTAISIPKNLQFDENNYTIQEIVVNNQTIKIRAYENIVYVANPVDTQYQIMNIYIPEAYFNNQSINGYTKDTAPIFMPNAVGGYMPAKPKPLTMDKDGKPNSPMVALSKGYVVASVGARGRTLKNTDGEFIGKGVAGIVDLKAGIRYLKANDKLMAGRADRIIVSGTSAGGAMTALLGATGNHKDYNNELKSLGALNTSDDVFAVASYCPITNLDNADSAYEWQFNGIDDYKKMSITMLDYNVKRELVSATLSDNEKTLSNQLKPLFPAYVNGLKLTGHNGKLLTLDDNGNGSFKDEVIYYLNKSVNTAHKKGEDLSSYTFLDEHKSSEPYYIADYQDYIKSYVGRGKGVPAFDGVALDRGENNLFGNKTNDNGHFTPFSQKNSTIANTYMADSQSIKMLNPMNYIGNNGAKTAQHWRIRHGAKDGDTSFAIPLILATALNNQGKSVDFAFDWGQGHSGEYDLDELFVWADNKVKSAQ